MTRISGILTPHLTPVDQHGRIDEQRLRAYIDWLIERGVDGLYPNGSTGEFIRFTPEERRQIVRIVIDQTAGRVPVLAGAAEANVKETIAACDAYGEMGATAVAIVAPFYYRLSDQGVYAYFHQIATAVSVDVTLYNIPLFASPIEIPTVIQLASECPRVVGIKDSSGDIPSMMRMIAAIRPMRDDFSFLTGWDSSLALMLIAGADGGTNATSGVVPELTRAIYRAVKAGEIDSAMRLQYQLLPLFETMLRVGEFPEGFRAGVRSRGWDLGSSRTPLSASQREALAKTQLAIDSLVASVTAQPCDSKQSDQDLPVDTIEQIVRRIMSQL